jgi:hypothetical protein
MRAKVAGENPAESSRIHLIFAVGNSVVFEFAILEDSARG